MIRSKDSIAEMIEEEMIVGGIIGGTKGETIEEMIAETIGEMTEGVTEETIEGKTEETTVGTKGGMTEEMIEGMSGETTGDRNDETKEETIGGETIEETMIDATSEQTTEARTNATPGTTMLVSGTAASKFEGVSRESTDVSTTDCSSCLPRCTGIFFAGRNQRQDSYVSEFPTLSSTGAGPGAEKPRETAENHSAASRPNQQTLERQAPPRQDMKTSQSQAGPTSTTHKFKSGQRVFAKYWEDNRMYRAVVHEMAATGETCVVQFVEYGNYEEVSVMHASNPMSSRVGRFLELTGLFSLSL